MYYDLAKVAVNRLAFSLGHELAARGGTAVSITPGFLRSEMMLDAFGVDEAHWRDAVDPDRGERGLPVAPPDFALSESPRFVGRAVAALAADPDRARWNQQSVSSGELARGVRLHRSRRLAPRCLALHRGGAGAGDRGRSLPVPVNRPWPR